MEYLAGLLKDETCVLFLTVALGLLLGKLRIKNISLGTSGTLFVGLLMGALGCHVYKGFFSCSLVFFVVAVGLLASKDISWVVKTHGMKFIVLGIVIPTIGAGITYLLTSFYSKMIDSVLIAGTYTGAMTSSPGLGAALEVTAGNKLVTLGHSIAYPFGVIGVILFIQLVPKILNINVKEEKQKLSKVMQVKQISNQNTIRQGTFSLITFLLVAIAGMLIGKAKLPLPFLSGLRLGSTGGALIFSLFVGALAYKRNKFCFNEEILKAIRTIALAFFLAVVGLQAGGGIVEVFKKAGFLLITIGILACVIPEVIGFLIGRHIYKMNWVLLSGAICGGMTSTPGLGTAIESAETEEVAAGYGATYPVALVMVVLHTTILHRVVG